MSTRKDLPNPNAPNFLQRVREEIHALLGKTGSLRDRALTIEDAIGAGLVGVGPGGSLIPGTAADESTAPDLTPPPPPTGVTAITSGNSILVTIDPQTYRQGRGPGTVLVFGAKYLSGDPLPVFADAAVLDEFPGDVHAFTVDPAALYRIWVKSVSRDGVPSEPAGGTNGIAPTPGLLDDVAIANLVASRIRSGSVTVGQFIQNANYLPAVNGWRINGDGTAEFSGVVARGAIFASQGTVGGWTIGSNYLQSTTYVLGTSGTRFNSNGTGQIGGITIYSEGLGAGSTAYDTGNGAWIGRDGKLSLKSATNFLKWDGANLQINGGGTFSGALSAATGTFAGSLSAATGTFSGALSAATGTFSGSLTADAVNAVNTINLAGNAVTVPVGVSSSASVSIQSNEATIQTAAIDAGGQPVCVFASAAFDGGRDSNATVTVRLRRNGSQIMASYVWVNDTNRPNTALVFADTPGPGIHTYTLTAYASGSFIGGVSALDRSLVLLGVKR